ncbi:MAG TPA: hypothetical protein VNX40_15785 [Mucilaginibacter sp.]|jgi:hypothetical protein|nr:hypothetical protein [Mucilaginibacter sp.]
MTGKNTPVINLSVNTGIDQLNNVDVQAAENKHQGNQITVNVVNPTNDTTNAIAANKIADTANKISIRTFFVNTGLFVITIIVVVFSGLQSYYASKSVGLADSVFQATKKFNDSSLKIQDTAYAQSRKDAKANDKREDDRDKRSQANIKIQNNALKAQIKSLQETQKEFKTENEGFLQIGNFDTIKFSNEDLYAQSIIYNLSKSPTKITKVIFYTRIEPIDAIVTRKTYDKIMSEQEAFNKNLYIIKESPQKFPFTGSVDFDSYTRYRVIHGLSNIFIYGRFYYKNIVTNTDRIYEFLVELNLVDGVQYIFRINENKDAKK